MAASDASSSRELLRGAVVAAQVRVHQWVIRRAEVARSARHVPRMSGVRGVCVRWDAWIRAV